MIWLGIGIGLVVGVVVGIGYVLIKLARGFHW